MSENEKLSQISIRFGVVALIRRFQFTIVRNGEKIAISRCFLSRLHLCGWLTCKRIFSKFFPNSNSNFTIYSNSNLLFCFADFRLHFGIESSSSNGMISSWRSDWIRIADISIRRCLAITVTLHDP